jgi:hypothetical protein
LKNGHQHQIYQVENDSNGNNNNNNYYNQNRGNNQNNWNNQNDNIWNRRPRYKNNNFNSFAPPSNLQSNFNANNFNNGGYRNNPSRFMPQNPPSQNQGWSQMPYGNPNQGMPTYAGQVPSWVDETVICFNCNQPRYIKPNCPNARASIPYIPICGNCKQNGHTAEECNGPRREGPRDNNNGNNNNNQNNNFRDNSAKLVLLPDDYNVNSNNNTNGNNQSATRNVNHVDVIRDNSTIAMDNYTPIDNVHNVTGVRTRGMLAKQIPSSSQPIVAPPVPPPIESRGSEKEPLIPPVVNLPIDSIPSNENLSNSSKAIPPSPLIIQPIVNESLTTGMPQVLFQPSDTPVGSKNFNPIIDKDNMGYNPIGTIPSIPPIINPPINKVLSEPSQLIKPPQNFPQLVNILVGLSIGSNIQPLKGRKARRSKPIGIMQDTIPYDLLADLGHIKADITIKQLLRVAPHCHSLLQSTLVRKRIKPVVNEISLNPDPGAPTVDVQIDGIIVSGVQIDGGSSVNLMNIDTMHSLHLSRLQQTKLMLRMADQSRVKPLGILL